MRAFRFLFFLVLLGLLGCQSLPVERSILGFDVSNASIPVGAIERGGPPPDGIPAIDHPQFTPTAAVDFLRDDDVVLGFSHGGEDRAYPLRILIWHEIVNDVVQGRPVLVSYCPLCGTAMVFDREVGGEVLSFGVSGLLYNSDVLMFDRQNRSLWSQLGMRAIAGPQVETALEWLPSRQMTWAAWRQQYPQGRVLNRETGHPRNYAQLPYQEYFRSPGTLFSYDRQRTDLAPKRWVGGVHHAGAAKAYPLAALPSRVWLQDTIGGAPVAVFYDGASGLLEVSDDEGNPLPVVHAFWFAWQAFYPETELWEN